MTHQLGHIRHIWSRMTEPNQSLSWEGCFHVQHPPQTPIIEMTDEEYYDLVYKVCAVLGISVVLDPQPGAFYALPPRINMHGRQLLIYQNRGYDV